MMTAPATVPRAPHPPSARSADTGRVAAGLWRRGGVRVCSAGSAAAFTALTARPAGTVLVESPHFRAFRSGGTLTVCHRFDAGTVSDDAADIIAAELDASGLLGGAGDFEAVLVGIVHTAPGRGGEDHGSAAPWLAFYRNSLAALEDGAAAFAPVHRRAQELVVGAEVLDLGSCFGFFPLRLARRRGRPGGTADALSVTATDISSGTMRLLASAASGLGRPLSTLTCDAAEVPLPDRAADTVTVLHLLEHLPPERAYAVLCEAVRLARRRVVVAVPFEEHPRACFGHVQAFDAASLHMLGARIGLHCSVTEHHGGWLVIDR